VTGYDPPGRLAGRGVAGPVRFQEEYRLTRDGAATTLSQSIRATPAARTGWPRACCAASFSDSGTRLLPRRLMPVPLRDVQEAASHADPRTTMRSGPDSLDRHATYIVAAYVAGAAR
jgi:hypothetical protein